MPLQAVSFRPQTTHQAKRAYQRAGGTPRLSATEIRRLERSAELEERAARIKAHNARARENKRKKAERLEKEREIRKRMGIPEPTKIKIGSSQSDLGAFVSAGVEVKREVLGGSVVPGEKIKPEVNQSPSSRTKTPTFKIEPALKEGHILKGKPLNNPTISHQSSVTSNPTTHGTIKGFLTAAALMPPPPPRLPLQKISPNLMGPPSIESPKNHSRTIPDADLDLMFASNTQVAREISESTERPPSPILHQKDTPAALVDAPPRNDPDLFAGISTQDLQYSSSSPSTVKSNPGENPDLVSLPEGSRDRMPPISSLEPKKQIITPRKRWPTSPLSRNELETIYLALEEMYRVELSLTDTRRLISGKRLYGPASIVQPCMATNMAIKIEEVRQGGEKPWVAGGLIQWAMSMQDMETREVRQVAASKLQVGATPTAPGSGHPPARPNLEPPSKRDITKTERFTALSTSFDEFDEFGLSSQDLRELDV